MSSERRNYHRIFTDIVLSVENHKASLHRVNISASGIAFQLDSSLAALAIENSILGLSFTIFDVDFSPVEVRIVRVSQVNNKLMIGCCFLNVDDAKKREVDRIILKKGGYQQGDADKKMAYLSWYAPEIAKEYQKNQ